MKSTWLLLALSFWLLAFSLNEVYGQYVLKFPVVQADLLEADGGPDHLVGQGTVVQLGGNVPAKGGTPPYLYSWQPGTDLSDSSIPNPSLTVKVTRTYTFIVTDADSCTASAQVFVEMLAGVSDLTAGKNGCTVYPNPSTDRLLYIQWGDSSPESCYLTLFSMTGQQVWSSLESGKSFMINFKESFLPPGVYTLGVMADGRRFYQKIILL